MPARPPGPVAGSYEIDTGTAVLERRHDDPGLWTLEVNGVPSSSLRPDEPHVLEFEYLQQMADVLDVLRPEPAPLRVLHLGGAGCALPWALAVRRPRSEQVVLELDARLTVLVRQWFALPRSPALRLQAAEAGAGLAGRRDASADAVVRDVFAGDTTPEHLRTAAFLAQVRRVLVPGGVYLANVADGPPLRDLRAEVATAQQEFAHVAVLAETAVLRGRRHANAVLVACDDPMDPAALHRAARGRGVSSTALVGERLRRFVAGAAPLG